jgi:hypothetical protein
MPAAIAAPATINDDLLMLDLFMLVSVGPPAPTVPGLYQERT